MLRHLIRVLFLLMTLSLSTLPALAQAESSSADLTGIIVDSAKALVSGASVTAVNLETMLSRTVTSNANGVYRIPLLPPGQYEIKVKAAGFNLQVKRGITLTVGQTAVINFDLAVGMKSEIEVIEVEAPVIEIERTHQASTITQKPINDLPINGRNFLAFAKLTPGVVEESPEVSKVQVPELQTSGLSFAGQNGRSNSVQIDGVDQNDIASNGVRPTISQEAVREFQINNSSYNAEFGRASAGIINIVSKSGASEFHGNFYNYFRNERLDARNTFASSYQQAPPFKRNQPGLTLGGPLRKDKTFFFLASEALIRRESVVTTILADPSILGPTPGQQELINTLINTGDMGRVMLGQQLQALLTTGPNSSFQSIGPAFQQNLATYNYLTSSNGFFPLQETASTTSLRIDQAFSERNYLFFRYGATNDSMHNTGVGGLFSPSAGYDIGITDQTAVIGQTHIFGNDASNEFRFQFVRNTFNANTVDPFGPRYAVAGIGTFGRTFEAPSKRLQYRQQVLDNFSLRRGRHNLKFGGDFNRYTFKIFTPVFGGGNIDFAQLPIPLGAALDPAAAGQLIGDLLTPTADGGLGRPDLASMITDPGQPLSTVQQINFGFPAVINQGFGNPNVRFNGYIIGLYAQDGIQVNQNLYLSFGLRYDYELQPPGTPRDKNNFGPRIGFTYSPFKDGKTLIRGGGGLYYQSLYSATSFVSRVLGTGQISNILVTADPTITPIDANSPCGLAGVPPSFCLYQQLVSTGLLGFASNASIPESAYLNLLGLTRATSANRLVVRLQDNTVNPYGFQGSLGIDRELGRDWTLSLNYLLNHGVKLIRPRQVNALPDPTRLDALGRPALTARADQTTLAAFVYETAGNSIYHGLTASMNKRFSRHYQVIGAYTFGNAIDDATDFIFEQGPQDPTNARADRGPSSFNVAHRLSVAALFDSPFQGGPGKPFYQRVLNNFYLSPIMTVRSGFPFNIVTGVDVNLDNNNNDRPFGVGRNSGIGPGSFTTDMRIGRRFNFGAERPRSVEAIFDIFNLFNRVNFRDANNSTGGVLYLDQLGIANSRLTGCSDKPANTLCGFTSAYDPRILQLAVKIGF